MAYINTSPLQSFMSRRDTHNYCEFYKCKRLIHKQFYILPHKFLSKIRNITFSKIRNTYTNETWTRKHNPKKIKQGNNLPNTRYTI